MTDIVAAVQTALQEDAGIQALVAAPYIGEDAGWVNGWIFDSTLGARIENSQRCAIVVSYGGGWNAPLDSNLVRFPLVVVDIWADPTRAADNSVLTHDAKAKCFRIYDEVFRTLHLLDRADSSGEFIYFGDTRIMSSEALGEPDLQWVNDGNGARMLRCRFGISY